MIQQAQDNNDQEYILLMLDIHKAFDSVLLIYLEEIMYAFNFPPAQGCALSPLLYVLVMESLALNIRVNAAIEGFQVAGYHKK